MAGIAAAKMQLWKLEVCPLFKFAVHDTVVNSALLEEKVATIHNFLVGVGGARLTALFGFVSDLADAALHPQHPPDFSIISTAELSLAVLSTLLDCGTSHIINADFEMYTNKFRDVAAASEPALPQDKFSKLQAAQYATFIGRRLKVGSSIPNAGPTPRAVPVELASFRLRKDMPGELSADGPRHDNDHADIKKISIMPTPDEIKSPRGEYFPTTDPSSWHFSGIRGRLDREFRLLREDTVGQLRDVVRTEIEYLQRNAKNKDDKRARRPNKDGIQYCVYEDTVISAISFDKFAGPEFLVRVRQPANGRASSQATDPEPTKAEAAKSLKQRLDWWTIQAKKRLQPGGLVCAIDGLGSVDFFTVADSTMRSKTDITNVRFRRNAGIDNAEQPTYTLADDPNYAYMRLTLSGVEGQNQLSSSLAWFLQSMIKKGSRLLVEFPGVLLASFLHTLQALQSGSMLLNIPFVDIIAPDLNHDLQQQDGEDGEDGDGLFRDLPPPRYIQKPGFVLDMSCLTADKQALQHSLDTPASAEEIERKTQLDRTQATALLEALSRSMALIQGPPGTGKTFLGVHLLKVLLKNRKSANLGPILIVCYTNHALDQLLEHVLDSSPGVNILRMGSRSKSERLNKLNLREAAMEMVRTKPERHSMWETARKVEELSSRLKGQFSELSFSTSLPAIRTFLRDRHKAAYAQIFGEDNTDDGFVTVRGNAPDTFRMWRNGRSLHPDVPVEGRRLWTLPQQAREALVQQWQAESFEKASSGMETKYASYEAAKKASANARQAVDLRCMKEADIVGMTTTGLAKNCNLLQNLSSKVLLCEEAGEVLEAHMLVSLLPSVEHAILIGDHRQLRPRVQNYELSSESRRGQQFSFDRSLFERLVSPPLEGEAAVPYSQLTTQRRMHPFISALIRAPLYPALEDGPNVQTYPEVSGMARRLFWFNHAHLEDGAANGEKAGQDLTSMSRTNAFEVEMTVALVSHLFKQGTYADGDIAVLTPYLGQMMRLRQRLSNMFELTFNERDTADLEAADELSTNAMQSGSPDSDAAANKATNDASGADAKNDVDTVRGAGKQSATVKTKLLNSIRVATVDNFQGEEAKVVVVSLVRSNAQRRCGFLRTSNRINVLLSRAQHAMYILGNSDTCSDIPMWQSVISALDADGNMGPNLPVQCPRHPERVFEVSLPDHFVQFAPDGGCLQLCDKRLACGHSCTGRCHADVIHAAVKCLEPCPRPLKGCSHACTRPCGEPCVPLCRVLLPGTVLNLPCGHVLTSPQCAQAQQPDKIVCRQSVNRTIPGCGHGMAVPCHEDHAAETFKCRAMCGATLPSLSAMPSTLRYALQPLAVLSAMQRAVHVLRLATGFRVPRDAKCASTVATNVSPSVCGEQCPDVRFCQQCGDEDVLDQTVEFIFMSTYRETQLDHDPCIFPSCGHVLTISSMDGVMDMAKHYATQETEAGVNCPVALAASSSPFDMKEAKACPVCRGSLRNIARYGRIVRRAVLDESTKRFIRWAHQQHGELASLLMEQKELLESETASSAKNSGGSGSNTKGPKSFFSGKGRGALIKELLLSTDRSRFDSLITTRAAIVKYNAQVAADEQPYKRVADLVQFALNRRRTNDASLAPGQFVFDESVIQTGSSLHAGLLLMRCDILALEQVAAYLEKATFVNKTRLTVRGPFGEAHTTNPATNGIQTLKRLSKTSRFADLLEEFEASIALARSAKRTRQEAESRVCCVQLCLALWKLYGWTAKAVGGGEEEPVAAETTTTTTTTSPKVTTTAASLSREALKETAQQHLEEAWGLVKANQSLEDHVGAELQRLEAALGNIAFYQPVSADEMRAVYKAMSREFSGSGHWYTCANGHPFTVGECGMPMQQARCPECSAPVGGQDHVNAQGVQHADAIEELGRGVGRLGL
ncbi:hypothetical protein SCUCBS95973_007397 [Sporothrix curviconia]|uniref:RZ-type domain-containing protein n=1 Tax=Sporothrix curviconia TaxID=1260050 RepID=A0ABP0CCZ6_9PEZI